MEGKTYSIGEVARNGGACNNTVIEYEKRGLLGEVRRNERGHRRYTHEQFAKFKQIFEARNR